MPKKVKIKYFLPWRTKFLLFPDHKWKERINLPYNFTPNLEISAEIFLLLSLPWKAGKSQVFGRRKDLLKSRGPHLPLHWQFSAFYQKTTKATKIVIERRKACKDLIRQHPLFGPFIKNSRTTKIEDCSLVTLPILIHLNGRIFVLEYQIIFNPKLWFSSRELINFDPLNWIEHFCSELLAVRGIHQTFLRFSFNFMNSVIWMMIFIMLLRVNFQTLHAHNSWTVNIIKLKQIIRNRFMFPFTQSRSYYSFSSVEMANKYYLMCYRKLRLRNGQFELNKRIWVKF